MSSTIAITDSEFETQVLKATQPVLVYFWASWCGPCRLMTPLINSAAQTYSDRLKVVKMEVDPNPTTVAKYKVEGVPALRLFNKGELIGSVEGIDSKQKITQLLESHL
ncbi:MULTISPECIES: thioredoxin family protein [Aerosakkonema]|uniref:thioredoxin family protein n=1 Tax=Aerosakkonema TaxID=1246629 RepID=UPI0035B8CED8